MFLSKPSRHREQDKESNILGVPRLGLDKPQEHAVRVRFSVRVRLSVRVRCTGL